MCGRIDQVEKAKELKLRLSKKSKQTIDFLKLMK